RQFVNPCEVEPFVKIALACDAVSKGDPDDPRLLVDAHRPCQTASVGQLRGYRAGLAHDPEATASPVLGHLPATAVGVGGLAKFRKHDLPDGHSQHQHDAE